MLKNYLLITFRNLFRNKVFVAINMLGMGIAVACCITAWLNWDFSTNFDKNHQNASSIYRVQAHYLDKGKENRHAMVPAPLGSIVKQNFGDVDKVVRYTSGSNDVRVGDEVFRTSVASADEPFFELFTFKLVDGSLSAFRDKSQIFISNELALKYFNTTQAAGKQLTLINKGEYNVGGVFEAQPLNSSFAFEAIVPWTDETNDWKNSNTLFLQINDPSRTAAIATQLQSYIEPQNKALPDFKLTDYYLQNFKTLAASFHGSSWLSGEELRWGFPPSAVLGPGIMAIFLLLLACFNFTNISVAMSGRRLKEIGIRKTMGGMRTQLVIQFLGESVVLCFLAMIAGLLIAEILVPAYNSLWPGIKLVISYTDNITFFVFLGALLLFTAVLAGMYPAFYITSFKPVAILKGKMKFGGTNWFTRTLLTFQFSISLLCMIMGVAFIRNASYQRDYDIGYAKDGIIKVNVAGQQEFETYRNLLRNNSDIVAIGGSKGHVSDKFYKVPLKFGTTELSVETVDIGEDYLAAMDIAIVEGRGFETNSETDKKESILVSEEFVKQMRIEGSAVGKRVLMSDSVQLFIVGVTKNILTAGFWKPVEPVMLRYIGPNKYDQMTVRAAEGKLFVVNDFMKEQWKKVSPNTLYSGNYVDGNIRTTAMINKNSVSIFGFLGIVAAVLSATGLFALLSLNILKRTKEIGVRKILGASAPNIARVINTEFVIILMIASVFGGGLGFLAGNKMMDAVWEYYKNIDAITLSICVATLFVVAGISVAYKTIITSLMNPVNTLRSE
ncbi:MAG TPA: ABC transporter permease [Cyclobacteriaceae bacterium]|nr:ABC transporter permease [Cyclobacteriaceae bacterium]